MKKNRIIKSKKMKDLTAGPAKLTKALELDMSFNGFALTEGNK